MAPAIRTEKDLSVAPLTAAYKEATKEKELHRPPRSLRIEFKSFYGYSPSVIDRRFDISLSNSSYEPKINNPRADWVVTAALNAFVAYQSAQFGHVQRFASIGTGSGTDIIAAVDVFPKLSSVVMTDIIEEVVKVAKSNLLSATEKADDRVRQIASLALTKAGDLLLPLEGEESFNLIYENLPNIPLPHAGLDLHEGQTSSTYVGDRSADKVPASISRALLELHYLCLVQAKRFGVVASNGAVLSSIGGRIPLVTMLEVARVAGYYGRILTMSWKEQSEPESVIDGYAEHERTGLGPFIFYPMHALEQAFAGLTPSGAGLHAQRIEDELVIHRLNAVEALQKYHEGVKIGHTVVVMASVLESRKSRREEYMR